MTDEFANRLHQFGGNQMPIVIMKTTSSPIAQSWIRPHAVWEGTKKSAHKWCEDKNGKAKCNTHYEAVTVKTEKNATNSDQPAPTNPARTSWLFYAQIMLKNITPNIITSTLPDFVVLEKALQQMPFAPTTGQQNKSVGWVNPRADGGLFVESVNSQLIMRFMAETRQVPASVVQSRVDEMVSEWEATTGRKPGKKERRNLQEQAVAELLPNAFPRKRATWVWIDREKRRLIIDSTSAGTVDDIITALVKLVDGFAVEPIDTATSPAVAMAAWLTEQAAPAGFDIGKACELKSIDETKAVVRYKNHSLLIHEVEAHIATGKQPTRLALDWDGRVSFVLTDNLQLKKVTFADSVLEQSKAQGQRADDFDGDVVMATSEIGQMLDELIAELDGVVK